MKAEKNNVLNPESQDISKYDFKHIFTERINTIDPIPEAEREDAAYGLEALSVTKIKKEIPALAFRMPVNIKAFEDTSPVDLWVVDPKQIRRLDQPHEEVLKDLAGFLNILEDDIDSKIGIWRIGGTLLQGEDDKLYLLLDEIKGDFVQNIMKSDQAGARFLDFLREYNINRVAVRVYETWQKKEADSISYGSTASSKIIIGEDLMGKRREHLFYINFARKYNMTNSQYLRLRLRTRSAFEAGAPIKWDDVAREIIEEDKEK